MIDGPPSKDSGHELAGKLKFLRESRVPSRRKAELNKKAKKKGNKG